MVFWVARHKSDIDGSVAHGGLLECRIGKGEIAYIVVIKDNCPMVTHDDMPGICELIQRSHEGAPVDIVCIDLASKVNSPIWPPSRLWLSRHDQSTYCEGKFTTGPRLCLTALVQPVHLDEIRGACSLCLPNFGSSGSIIIPVMDLFYNAIVECRPRPG